MPASIVYLNLSDKMKEVFLAVTEPCRRAGTGVSMLWLLAYLAPPTEVDDRWIVVLSKGLACAEFA